MVLRADGPILRNPRRVGDDLLFVFGIDSDIALLNRSATLTADAEVTGVIVGTSDHQGVAANSLLISNITASGDIGLYVNNGGNSLEALLVDASASALFLGFGLASVRLSPLLNFINDDANAGMTRGLTINQGSADDEILAFKSSDIAHGVTALAETDTFGMFRKESPTNGGVLFNTFTAADLSLDLRIVATTDNTAKTTGAIAPLYIWVQKRSGTGVTGVFTADSNLAVIARTSGLATFIFDVEGSAHAEVEWIAFEHHDDLALISDMEKMLLGRETEAQTYRRHMLEEAKIIGKDSWREENGKLKAMVNFTKLAMLHHGALIQVNERFRVLEQKMLSLEGGQHA